MDKTAQDVGQLPAVTQVTAMPSFSGGRPARVLLISGSLREASTNTALPRSAVSIAPPGIEPVMYDGMGRIPHFNPDLGAPLLDPAVAQLRTMIHWSDAILFSTPECAGALLGSFKNVLDWTIGNGEPGSIY